MRDPGIVRNRLKIDATVTNARQVLAVQEEHGSLAAYLWQFVDGRPVRNAWSKMGQVPAETAQSRAMSRALLARGFRFVGPTICYAFMQATGMVDDHITTCFRYSTRRSPRS
jgi:DNA-3-methyladenine glycosylase I